MTLIDNRHILLMQIRNDPRVRQEEHESFARHSGLAPSQIDILNVFDTPRFSADEVKGYDALFVGARAKPAFWNQISINFLIAGNGCCNIVLTVTYRYLHLVLDFNWR